MEAGESYFVLNMDAGQWKSKSKGVMCGADLALQMRWVCS